VSGICVRMYNLLCIFIRYLKSITQALIVLTLDLIIVNVDTSLARILICLLMLDFNKYLPISVRFTLFKKHYVNCEEVQKMVAHRKPQRHTAS
jgi:hypothetical protein